MLNVLDLLQSNPTTTRSLFIAYHHCLTADILQDLFKPAFSPVGSNESEKQEQVVMFWINVLQ